jgi:hypothetical protein
MELPWVDPRYAALVEHYERQQDSDTDVPPLALGPEDAPGSVGRGFILERLDG